ncbi:DUF5723 family protein [bacterium]|nr:DUF5723 family protein [bacterium]
MRTRKNIFWLFFLLILFVNDSFAFRIRHGRAISMGGGHAVSARGVEAVGWNPAFLAFSDGPAYSFNLPLINLNYKFSNDLLSINLLNEYAQEDRYLTKTDKLDILGSLDNDNLDFDTYAYLPVVAISFPTSEVNMALTADLCLSGGAVLSDQFLRTILLGYTADDTGTTRVFTGDAEILAAWRIGLTNAKSFDMDEIEWLDELTAGFTVSYYSGIAYADILEGHGELYMTSTDLKGNGIARVIRSEENASGTGIGLDLGIAGRMLDRKAIVGLSWINISSSMEWNNLTRHRYSFEVDGAPAFDQLTDSWLEDHLQTVDEEVSKSERAITRVPSVFRVAGGYQLKPTLLLTTGLDFQLNNSPGEYKTAEMGAGVEWSVLKFLPLRAGAKLGGHKGFTLGTGFGLYLGNWRTDIGWSYAGGILQSAEGFSFGINTVFFFGKNENSPKPSVVRERDEAPKRRPKGKGEPRKR